MSAHEILILVMAAFAVLGAADRIFGNRFGIGQEFENGILAMGSLALALVGIIALAPVLANVLRPVIVPVFGFFGADPAMFAGTILACDMGGGSLAQELTSDPAAAHLGGVITGSFPPCGVCRQVMREFCKDDFIIYMMNPDGYEAVTLTQLLPYSFSNADMH